MFVICNLGMSKQVLFLHRYQEYGMRYCAGEKTSYGWDFSGSSNMQELQLLLRRTCVIRRLKNDVLNQLPAKKR